MIGCSSLINDKIWKEAMDLGFDMVLEAPIQSLTADNIINIINLR